jgi:hypothetical protein
MSEPKLSAWSNLPARVAPISGGVVLALTAAPWMQSAPESSADPQRTYTLWGLLASVSHVYLTLLIIAIVLLLAYAVGSMVLPLDRMGVRSVLGWLAVAATVGIIVNLDRGSTAGAGAVLTLVVCVATALLTSLAPLLQPTRRPAMPPRT